MNFPNSTKVNLLNYLKINFNALTDDITKWHFSPILLLDPDNDLSSTRVRISGLDGNRLYNGYRDFTYTRIDLNTTNQYNRTVHVKLLDYDLDPLDMFYDLSGVRLSAEEVDIEVDIIDRIGTVTATIKDPGNLLWFGTVTFTITSIPHISELITGPYVELFE